LVAVRCLDGPRGDSLYAHAEFVHVLAATIACHHQRRGRSEQHDNKNPRWPRSLACAGTSPDGQQHQSKRREHRPFQVHGDGLAGSRAHIQVEHARQPRPQREHCSNGTKTQIPCANNGGSRGDGIAAQQPRGE